MSDRGNGRTRCCCPEGAVSPPWSASFPPLCRCFFQRLWVPRSHLCDFTCSSGGGGELTVRPSCWWPCPRGQDLSPSMGCVTPSGGAGPVPRLPVGYGVAPGRPTPLREGRCDGWPGSLGSCGICGISYPRDVQTGSGSDSILIFLCPRPQACPCDRGHPHLRFSSASPCHSRRQELPRSRALRRPPRCARVCSSPQPGGGTVLSSFKGSTCSWSQSL